MSRHRNFAGGRYSFDGYSDDEAWDSGSDYATSPRSPSMARFLYRPGQNTGRDLGSFFSIGLPTEDGEGEGNSRSGQSLLNRIEEGSRVRAVYEYDGEWYPGIVRRAHSDGTYSVQFDGYREYERVTKIELVKPPERRQGDDVGDEEILQPLVGQVTSVVGSGVEHYSDDTVKVLREQLLS